MKLRGLALTGLFLPSAAYAGGLFIPGSGAISTSRAGAAVASTEGGEALSNNPAGLAKSAPGTTITVSAAIISYALEFDRTGTYDNLPAEDPPYEGTPFVPVKNAPRPKFGVGSYQPIPVVAIVSDLGGRVKGLHVAAGMYAPNAYPFRDMSNGYVFNGDFNKPPPASRYDIVKQDAAIFIPSIAASYRVIPQLDVGARFSVGFGNIDSTTTVWGTPGNVVEDVKSDTLFRIKAKDNFMPGFGLGVTYRPTPSLEIGATYNSQFTVHAKGDATSEKGPQVNVNMEPIEIGPTDGTGRCEPNKKGDFQRQYGCVDFALPMSATVGARYIMRDRDGKEMADVELDGSWENWSTQLASTYKVVVDADVYINNVASLELKDNAVRHELKDVFSVRLGGSYHIPQGDNDIIVRGGIAHDTKTAKEGWLRSDVDGAARTTFAVGGAYKTKKFQIDVGGGFVYEGTNTNPGTCNVLVDDPTMKGCNNDGNERPIDQRQGPDPISPIVRTEEQTESPVALGTYKSHYVLFMLGFSTWF